MTFFVGGVAIPKYIMTLTAVTGCAGCLCYCYSHEMNSKYGVKLPDRLTRLMTGTGTLVAGFAVCDIYGINMCLERVRDMDKKEFAKMKAGKFPKWFIASIAGPMILGAGAGAMATATGYEMYSFHKDFMKNRAMEGYSANPYVLTPVLSLNSSHFSSFLILHI